MFYLVEFFKSLGESLAKGFSFLFISCLLAFSLTHRPWIAQTIAKISPEKIANPFFVAVIDDQVDGVRFRNTLAKLPGVAKIDERSESEEKHKLNALVNQLGANYQLSADMMNFKAFRITLNPSLSSESMDFVREQIIKLGGTDHLTATEVKYPEVTNMMKSHPFYQLLGSKGEWVVIGVLALIWILCYWQAYDVFRSRSYIIEKFQRKKFVASKSLATGLGIIVVTFTALGVLNGTVKFFDTILLLMIFSVFWTFSMQNWSWKPAR